MASSNEYYRAEIQEMLGRAVNPVSVEGPDAWKDHDRDTPSQPLSQFKSQEWDQHSSFSASDWDVDDVFPHIGFIGEESISSFINNSVWSQTPSPSCSECFSREYIESLYHHISEKENKNLVFDINSHIYTQGKSREFSTTRSNVRNLKEVNRETPYISTRSDLAIYKDAVTISHSALSVVMREQNRKWRENHRSIRINKRRPFIHTESDNTTSSDSTYDNLSNPYDDGFDSDDYKKEPWYQIYLDYDKEYRENKSKGKFSALHSFGDILYDAIFTNSNCLENLCEQLSTKLSLDHFSNEVILKTIISSSCFIVQVFRNPTLVDVTLATHQFVLGLIDVPYSKLVTMCKEFISGISDISLQTQGLDSTVHHTRALFHHFFNGPLATLMRNLILMVFSHTTLGNEYKLAYTSVFGRLERVTFPKFMDSLFEALVSIINVKNALNSGMPFGEYLFSTDPVGALVRESEFLCKRQNNLYVGLPIEGFMDQREYLVELDALILRINNLNKQYKTRSSEWFRLSACIDNLSIIKRAISNQVSGRRRMPPIGIVIFGPPGIGKSSLVSFMCKIYCAVKKIEFKETMIYAKPPTSDFWDEHNPDSQRFIHISEPGSKHVEIAKKNGDESIIMLTSLIDSLGFPLDMADVTKKGKFFANPDMCVADCNDPNMNLNVIVNNPSAYWRRFTFIEPKVKPEYCKPGTFCLDSDKVLELGVPIMSVWTLKVFSRLPIDNKTSREVVHLENADIYEFSEYMYKMFENRIATENRVHTGMRYDIDEYLPKELRLNPDLDTDSKTDSIYTEGARHPLVESFSSGILSAKESFKFIWDKKVVSSFYQSIFLTFQILFLLFSESFLSLYNSSSTLVALLFLETLDKACPSAFLRLSRWKLKNQRKETWSKLKYQIRQTRYLILGGDKPVLDLYSVSTGKNFLYGFIATLGVILVGYMVSSRKKPSQPQQSKVFAQSSTVDEPNIPSYKKYENLVSAGDSYKRVPIKNSELWATIERPLNSKGLTLGNVADCASRNIRFCKVVTKESSLKTHLFGISHTFALINTHTLRPMDENGWVLEIMPGGEYSIDDTKTFRVHVVPDDVYDMGNDISIMNIHNIRFRNIVKYLNDIPIADSTPFDSVIMGDNVLSTYMPNGANVQDQYSGIIKFSSLISYVWQNHSSGKCGLPLVGVYTTIPRILGVHCAGSDFDSKGYSVPLIRSDVEHGISMLQKKFHLLSEGKRAFFSPELPNAKSAMRYEFLPNVRQLGKLSSPVVLPSASRLIRSPHVLGAAQIFGSEVLEALTNMGPPPMRPLFVNGEWKSPFNNALRVLGEQKPLLNRLVMRKTVDAYISPIISELKRLNIPKLSPLTVYSAMNGPDVDPFIRRMNFSTASGFGWKGNKLSHTTVGSDGIQRFPSIELSNRLETILEGYLNGETEGFVYNACLKDEARSNSKNINAETRVFYVSQFEAVVISRMFLAPLYSLIVQFGEVFGTSVGINMQSGADKFYRDLSSFSDIVIEGDFKKFDASVCPDLTYMVAEVLYELARNLGYNDAALMCLQGVLTDLCFSVYNVLTDIIEIFGTTPSGKYGTAEDNSIKVQLSILYLWYYKYNDNHREFILLRTYGDDFLEAITPEGLSMYSAEELQSDMWTIMGMKLTGSDKTKPLCHAPVSTASFLKRTFVYSSELNRYIAPLDPASIAKSLAWVMPSKSVPLLAQISDTWIAACWEKALHLGSQDYCRLRDNVINYFITNMGFDRSFAEIKVPTWEKIAKNLQGIDDSVANSCQSITDPNTSQYSVDSYCEGHALVHSWGEPSNLLGISSEAWRLFPKFLPANNKISMELLDLQNILTQEKERLDNELLNYPKEFVDMSVRYLRSNPNLASHPKVAPFYDSLIYLKSRRDDCVSTLLQISDMLASREEISIYTQADRGTSVMDSGPSNSKNKDEFQNLMDMAGEESKEVSAGTSDVIPLGQHHLLSLDDFFARPVIIYTTALSASSNFRIILSPWDLYTLVPTVRAKLRNYAFFKGTLHLRIAIAGTPFNYGRVLLSYQPLATHNATLSAYKTDYTFAGTTILPALNCYLSQAPGATVVDVKENKPVDMSCPFISAKPMFRLFDDFPSAIGSGTSFPDLLDAGDLYITTLNQIKSVQTAQPLPMTIYAWMTDVQLGVTTATQIAITTESNREKSMGPLESFASKAVSVAKLAGNIPWLKPYAFASQEIASGVGKFAHIFGLSKPVALNEPRYMKNMAFQNGAQCIGYDTSWKLSVDPKQEVSIDPRNTGVEEDDLAISSIVERESYYRTITWSPTDTSLGSPILLTAVNPWYEVHLPSRDSVIVRQPTALSFGSRPFSNWHGKIVFRIEVVSSSFHRGKLAIFYEPNIYQYAIINSSLSLNKQFMKVIDIQETQSVEFCVDWSFPRPYARNNTRVDQTNTISLSSASFDSFNGYIAIVPLVQLVSPDNAGIDVNIYVRGEDMKFQLIDDFNFPDHRKIYTQSDRVSSQSVECIGLNEVSEVSEELSSLTFGENHLSFRTLLKRFVAPTGRILSVPANATTTKLLHYSAVNLPEPSPAYSTSGTTAACRSLYDYLRYAYVGMRGGMRHRIHLYVNATTNYFNTTFVSNIPPGDTNTAPIVNITTLTTTNVNPANLIGTISYNNHSNGGIEFEVPNYNTNTFLYSFSTINATTDTTTYDTTYLRNFTVVYPLNGVTDAGVLIDEIAAGEDFSLMRFQGAPYYTRPG